MRHRRRNRRLGRTTPHKKAMMRNMVTSLLKHGRISTTVTRAKELRMLADKMITLGKNGTLHARRQALSVIREKPVVAKLFNELAPELTERNGGYTRIIRTGPRKGDGSMMCFIELVGVAVASTDKVDNKVVDTDSVESAPSVIPTAADIEENPVVEEASAETGAKEQTEEEVEEHTQAEETLTSEEESGGEQEQEDVEEEILSAEDKAEEKNN